MTKYNMTAFNHTAGDLSLYFDFANQATNNMFGVFMLLAFFVIVFISLKGFGNRQALGASSVLTLIFAFLARSAGIVTDLAMYISIVITALVGVYLYTSKD